MNASARIYRLCLRAYPAAYRRERGAEILATLDEAGGRLRAREVIALLTGGIRERGQVASGGASAGMWASGAQLGALIVLVFTVFMYQFGNQTNLAIFACLAAFAVCRGRPGLACLAAIAAAGETVTYLPHATTLFWDDPNAYSARLYAMQVAYTLFLLAPVLALWPTRNVAVGTARHSLLWFAVPVGLLLATSQGYYSSTFSFGTLAVIGVGLLVLGRLDPRLSVAAMVVGVATGAYLVPVIIQNSSGMQYEYANWAMLLAVAGAIVAAVSVRRRPALY